MTAVDHQELNRLARSQAHGPATATGGRSRGLEGMMPAAMDVWLMAQRSTSAIRALYQFMNRLIDRLIVR